jgi:hypothetical protein
MIDLSACRLEYFVSITTELKNSTVLQLEKTSTVAGFELVVTTICDDAMHSLVRCEVTTMRCGAALDCGAFRPIDES